MLKLLAQWMRTNPSISSIVGKGVYVRRAFEKSPFPRVVIKQAGQTFGMTHGGPDGLDRMLIQVDCYGIGTDEGDQATRLADAVVKSLHGFKGTIAGAVVQGVFGLNRSDAVERRNEATEELFFLVSVTFKVVAVSI